jgi:hypothetical protein
LRVEIFLVSFVAFLVSAAALMLGQFFGRGPVSASCSPKHSCLNTAKCKADCIFKDGTRPDGGVL